MLLLWLNRDPIQERGGLNLYDYVGNDPINAIDPLGLWTFEIYGGWGFAGYLSFGYNDNHVSFRIGLGGGAGLSTSFDPKNKKSDSDLQQGATEGGLMGKLDADWGALGGGIEGEVGGAKDRCNQAQKYAKGGISGNILFYQPDGEISKKSDPATDNWEPLETSSDWQETLPGKDAFQGHWAPKKVGFGGFAGWYIGRQ